MKRNVLNHPRATDFNVSPIADSVTGPAWAGAKWLITRQAFLQLSYLRLYSLGLAIMAIMGFFGGCQTEPRVGPGDAKIAVVASFSILGDWVREVGGKRIAVTTLVGPNEDAHAYQPTPADGVAIHNARLIFEMGLGFETWLDKLFLSSGSKSTRVVVTDSMASQVIHLDGDSSSTTASTGTTNASPSHSHSEVDPHVWHSPTLVKAMIERIAAALSELDPDGASEYRQRAAAYLKSLDTLNQEIKTAVATIPQSRRHLVTTHDTFAYFARDYGFAVSNLLGSVSSEVSDPSAAEMQALIERIRSHEVPAVFSENILDEKLTEQVAREANVQVIATLRTDALGAEGTDGDTYLKMMRHNLAIMVESLR
jgi:zinc/manganese transport system substrate-binding protein